MTKNSSRRNRRALAITMILCVITVTLTLILGVLYLYQILSGKQAQEPVPEAPTVETTPPAPTPVVVPDGQSSSLRCLDSYTARIGSDGADRVAAVCGSEELTNAQLQIYYLNAIRSFQMEGFPNGPDFSQPLETQLCPLGDGTLSWQHYFLQKALDAWQTELLLLQAAKEPRPVQEEAFKPNETDDLHGKYVAKELPVNNFLYQDQPCYKPNSMHQAYLDGLEEQLEKLAVNMGYASLDDCAESLFAGTVSAQELVEAAMRYNTAYMLFTEESYDITVTDREVEDYLAAHMAELSSDDDRTVTFRHILLIPAGAKIAADGTVVATEAQWENTKKQAESILTNWNRSYLPQRGLNYNFAWLANQESMDAGSKLNGGLYENIHPGQLLSPLDEWLFDKTRKEEDIAILRSEVGYHIVFFCGTGSAAREQAKQALTQEKALKQWEAPRKKNPLKVDYSAVELWVDTNPSPVLPVDVLYPDIAHERFPEAMVYFQQDFMYSPYGGGYVGRGGCGITTMAMLATYMTDTILSPAMLAERYPGYHDESGTRGELFRDASPELGFFMEKSTSKMSEIIAALENGQPVISLQHQGHFTSGGHYLLLQEYYRDNDTFQVRDSNIYNYGKLKGHQVDYFTRENILSGGATFYIMQKKITRIPACGRCGEDRVEKLMTQEYLCPKCAAALTRRDAYLALMAEGGQA